MEKDTSYVIWIFSNGYISQNLLMLFHQAFEMERKYVYISGKFLLMYDTIQFQDSVFLIKKILYLYNSVII